MLVVNCPLAIIIWTHINIVCTNPPLKCVTVPICDYNESCCTEHAQWIVVLSMRSELGVDCGWIKISSLYRYIKCEDTVLE